MKANVKHSGMWWTWVENCDRCGKLIRSHLTQNSCEPNMKETDFCMECLRYLIDNSIPYEAAKQHYKSCE